MIHTLTLLVAANPTPTDRAIRKLAGRLGVSCTEREMADFLRDGVTDSIVAVGVSTLRAAFADDAAAAEARRLLHERAGGVLIHGFAATDADARWLQQLTDGALQSVAVVPAGRRQYAFGSSLDRRQVPIGGLSWETSDTADLCTFDGAAGDHGIDTLVAVNGRPLLVTKTVGGKMLGLLASTPVADIDQTLSAGAVLSDFYAGLLPVVVFLRTAFGPACWTNPHPSANFIIDDPLLQPRYGFIQYRPLMANAEAHRYAVTLAFIPFNHKRSNRRLVGFLQQHRSRFSVAVHGCDHNGGEYGSPSEAELAHRSRLSLVRMQDHERRTTMPFERVMIFPQGIYSKAAIRALKQTGYLAAVNSDIFPVNSGASGLTLRDVIDGAITAYDGFPIFLRRYPESVFDLSADLLFGKPVLVVEHHSYFKPGYAHFATFVEQLRQHLPYLAWKPLGDILGNYALVRQDDSGRTRVKFFCPVFRLQNPGPIAADFHLEKPEPAREAVDGVLVDGRPVEFSVEAGSLRCCVTVEAGGSRVVEVTYRKSPATPYQFSFRYRYAAAARRYLSEIRDNYLSRHERLLSIATKLVHRR